MGTASPPTPAKLADKPATRVSGRTWKTARKRASSMRHRPSTSNEEEKVARRERLKAVKTQERELKAMAQAELDAKKEEAKQKRREKYEKEKKAETFSVLTKMKNTKKNRVKPKDYGKIRMMREGVFRT